MASVNLLRLPAFQGRFNDSTISVVPAPELVPSLLGKDITYVLAAGVAAAPVEGRSDAGHAGDAITPHLPTDKYRLYIHRLPFTDPDFY